MTLVSGKAVGCPAQTPGVRPQSTSPWHQRPKDRAVIPWPARPAVTGGAAVLCAHVETSSYWDIEARPLQTHRRISRWSGNCLKLDPIAGTSLHLQTLQTFSREVCECRGLSKPTIQPVHWDPQRDFKQTSRDFALRQDLRFNYSTKHI